MLNKLKNTLLNNIFIPQIIQRGWTKARMTPLDAAYLKGEFGYDDESEIKVAVSKVTQNTMTSFQRLASLWQQVRYLDKYSIKGSFVECGVWKGGSVGMMALTHLSKNSIPNRTLHLFDSFQGLPEPKAEVDGAESISYSGNHATGKLEPINQCVGTLDENRKFLEKEIGYPSNLIKYHVGWFENTVAKDAADVGPIALLRLDGDWYESTRICLEHLYPKVVKGGIIIIDDYGHWEGCKKVVDEFISTLGEPILLNHIDYTGRYWIKP